MLKACRQASQQACFDVQEMEPPALYQIPEMTRSNSAKWCVRLNQMQLQLGESPSGMVRAGDVVHQV